jgi:hypothetical protein
LLPAAFTRYSQLFQGPCKFTRIQINPVENWISYNTVVSNGTIVVTNNFLEINFDSGINNTWAERSVLVFWGIEGGPSGTDNPFDHVVAFSILPGDTLVTDTHTQLHHYPWSGIVKGDMLYPRYTLSGSDAVRNNVPKRIVKAAASAGLTGLLVDEATFE